MARPPAVANMGALRAPEWELLMEAWLPCAGKRRGRAHERAGGGDGEGDGLGK
jgi:hypothetical protein